MIKMKDSRFKSWGRAVRSRALAGASIAILLAIGCGGAAEPRNDDRPAGPISRPDDEPTPRTPAAPTRFEYSRGAMGVHARILLFAADEGSAARAAEAAFEEIARWEMVLSDYNPQSELRRLEETLRPGVWTPVSAPFAEALTLAFRLSTETSGAFDPTIGAVTRVWREARERGGAPDPELLEQARRATGLPLIEFDVGRKRLRVRHPAVRLDFGGIGKGLAADAALATLADHDCPSALVDLGGDLAIGAPPPGKTGWRIGLEAGIVLPLAGCGIATSGAGEQALVLDGVRHSHILDPQKKEPRVGAPTITVRAPTAAIADAWATALSVQPAMQSRLETREGYEVWSEAP